MKRLQLGFIVTLLAASTLTGCDSPQATTPTALPSATGMAQVTSTNGPLTKATIALGYIPNVQFTPYYVALEKGYYRAEGLDVTFKHGIVPDLIAQLGVGDAGVNFAAASGDELIPARLNGGVPVVYVMTWFRQYPVAAASIEGKGPALKNPADLKGRKVGVPGPYGANYTGLQALLKAGGLTLDDVQVESIGFTQVESLSQGQVDVAMVYAANEPTQLRSQGLNVNTLMVSDYAPLAANGLATNEKTLLENPELVGKVVRATLKGIQDTVADPQAAFTTALKVTPEIGTGDRDLQLEVLKETAKLMQPKTGDPAAKQPLGWTDAAVWSATQDFLLEAKVVTKKGDVGEMFTNKFIKSSNGNGGNEGGVSGRPSDFTVEYSWWSGSTPPPYHYEYDLKIGPGSKGEIVFRPGYPGSDTPVWTETFPISDGALDNLYKLLVERKILRKDWKEMRNPPVGGSVESMTVLANNESYKVPSHVEEEGQALAEVYEAIRSMVPKQMWDDLMARRETYMEEQKR